MFPLYSNRLIFSLFQNHKLMRNKVITFLSLKLVDYIEASVPLKEKLNSAYKFALCGNMMLAISMGFIAPVPFVNMTPSFRVSQV